jgi:hypothetical protein
MDLLIATAWQPEIRSLRILILSGETNDPKPCEAANLIALGVEQRDDSVAAPHIAAKALAANEGLIIERKKKVRENEELGSAD